VHWRTVAGDTMQDEREWVRVDVTWDEDHDDEELEWDSSHWVDEPLYDPKPQQLSRLAFEQYIASAQRFDNRSVQREERAKPKREKERSPMTKRKRKRMRAWEVEDDE
jgi:hypothetical protein